MIERSLIVTLMMICASYFWYERFLHGMIFEKRDKCCIFQQVAVPFRCFFSTPEELVVQRKKRLSCLILFDLF